jgi:membrane-bound lytic murein transglycosylase F
MVGPTSTPADPPARSSQRMPWRAALALLAAGLLGTCSVRPGVLEQIRMLGMLKVATRNSPTAYYLGAQGPEGPEYELVSRFARELGVPVSFVSLASPDSVIEAVATGRAHIGAAGLSIAAVWRRQVAFSRPYQRVRLHLIHRRDKPRPVGLEALGARTLEVVAGSTHAAALAELVATVPGLKYSTVEGGDTLDLLDKVWTGELDTTIADRNEFSLTRNFHPELRIAFNLPIASELAWALPRGDAALAARVDAYLASIEADMPALVQRYYAPDDRFDYAGARQLVRDAEDRLLALRPHFEATAREFGEDWRVLAAIGYQESRWNPLAVSPTGVRGLMMLTAETAEALGIENRDDPAQSIRGGAGYLHQMRESIPAHVPEPDRTWLALAAYNVGYGHLEDARVLAQSHGKDPDSWQDVREFLPMLAQERFYVQLKRGYARGWEAVRFVDNIRNYLDVLEWVSPEPSPTPN